jgi:hypothetical protein
MAYKLVVRILAVVAGMVLAGAVVAAVVVGSEGGDGSSAGGGGSSARPPGQAEDVARRINDAGLGCDDPRVSPPEEGEQLVECRGLQIWGFEDASSRDEMVDGLTQDELFGLPPRYALVVGDHWVVLAGPESVDGLARATGGRAVVAPRSAFAAFDCWRAVLDVLYPALGRVPVPPGPLDVQYALGEGLLALGAGPLCPSTPDCTPEARVFQEVFTRAVAEGVSGQSPSDYEQLVGEGCAAEYT